MWVNRRVLGAGYAAILVALAVQELRLPWTAHFGGRQHGDEAAGRMGQEKKWKTRLIVDERSPESI